VRGTAGLFAACLLFSVAELGCGRLGFAVESGDADAQRSDTGAPRDGALAIDGTSDAGSGEDAGSIAPDAGVPRCSEGCAWGCAGEICADAARLVVGGSISCVVLHTGAIACWGNNANGQLADGTTRDRSSPFVVPSFTGLDVAVGMGHVCAIDTAHDVSCWGANWSGQLGNGGTIDSSTPQRNDVLGAAWIRAGEMSTCAGVADGTTRCWGNNTEGQLGTGERVDFEPAPVQGALGLTTIDAMTGGGFHTCAVADGRPYCWGDNSYGQLGDGTLADRFLPAPIMGITDAVGVAAGAWHTCVVHASGSVSCLGSNTDGELGTGAIGDPQPIPVAVVGIGDAVQVSLGIRSSCALRAGGRVSCWGFNDYGQVGNGTTTDQAAPADVTGLVDAVSIAVGGLHACALRADRSVVCWGFNAAGQLGNGTTTSSSTPVTVLAP